MGCASVAVPEMAVKPERRLLSVGSAMNKEGPEVSFKIVNTSTGGAVVVPATSQAWTETWLVALFLSRLKLMTLPQLVL